MTDSRINKPLLTCPFCGLEANYHHKNWGDGHVVRCSNKPTCLVDAFVTGETQEQAFERWNTRNG